MTMRVGPLVCARRGSDGDVFIDSRPAVCVRCRAEVVYRPHNAHIAAVHGCICYECWETTASPDARIVATPRTIDEWHAWRRRN